MFDRENGELRGRLKAASCLLRNGSSSSSSSVYTGIYDDQYVVYPDWAADRETRKLTLDDLIKYSSEISPDFIVLRDAWPRDNNNDDDEVTATARTSLTEKRFRYLPEVSRRRDKVVYICVGVCVCVWRVMESRWPALCRVGKSTGLMRRYISFGEWKNAPRMGKLFIGTCRVLECIAFFSIIPFIRFTGETFLENTSF